MAYLHIGQNVMLEEKRIIGIFDLDNTSTSKKTREFLNAAEEEGVVQTTVRTFPSPLWCATTPTTGRSSIYPS